MSCAGSSRARISGTIIVEMSMAFGSQHVVCKFTRTDKSVPKEQVRMRSRIRNNNRQSAVIYNSFKRVDKSPIHYTPERAKQKKYLMLKFLWGFNISLRREHRNAAEMAMVIFYPPCAPPPPPATMVILSL